MPCSRAPWKNAGNSGCLKLPAASRLRGSYAYSSAGRLPYGIGRGPRARASQPKEVPYMRIANGHYLIIDLEATCSSDDTVARGEMEIIEIGAVLQDARSLAIESEFQIFIRPVRHGRLTPF